MKPTEFKEQRTILTIKPYQPLPVFYTETGVVICCWKLSLRERIKLLFTGRLWIAVLTNNDVFHPLLPTVDKDVVLTME